MGEECLRMKLIQDRLSVVIYIERVELLPRSCSTDEPMYVVIVDNSASWTLWDSTPLGEKEEAEQ